MLRVLEQELHAVAATLSDDGNGVEVAVTRYRRFGELIRNTPALRSYQAAVADRFGDIAAEVLAVRVGLPPEDTEPQVTAAALLGLWKIQFRSLRIHLQPGRPVAVALGAVTLDVHRAASLIENGLATFPTTHPRSAAPMSVLLGGPSEAQRGGEEEDATEDGVAGQIGD
jgi:hypothetical protein